MSRILHTQTVALSDGHHAIPVEKQISVDDQGNPRVTYVTAAVMPADFWQNAKESTIFVSSAPLKDIAK